MSDRIQCCDLLLNNKVVSDSLLNDQFVLITKPEQGGKTFIMIDKIKSMLSIPTYNYRQHIVNFIFCDNSLLLNTQTKERFKTDIYVDNDTNMECIDFSSSSRTKTKSRIRELIEDGIHNIVCCTNDKRVNDIGDIIDRINIHNGCFDNGTPKYHFNLWLDEADKHMHYMDKIFLPYSKKYNNIKCYMMTATAIDLFKKYGDIVTLPIEKTTTEQYHGWKDNEIIIEDNNSSSVFGFAKKVMTGLLNRGELLSGHKGFVPAGFKQKSHREMRDMLTKMGVAVFVVNGSGIELALPNNPNHSYVVGKTKQLSSLLIELYNKYNVNQWPCVITGNACISRGISILNPKFMLDFAILSETRNKAETSQKAGRVKGNIKDWPGYKPIKVYTTSKFDKIASEYELTSRTIATEAFKKMDPFTDTCKMSYNYVKNIPANSKYETATKEFSTLDEANRFLKANKFNRRNVKYDDDGFILSSSSGRKKKLSYYDVKQELAKWSNISNLDINKKTGCGSRLYICYKDMLDKNSVVFIVKITIPKSSSRSIVYTD